MDFSQQQQLSQQMKLSPQMLQSLSFLAMNSQELADSIYQETLKNPALEIVRESKYEVSGINKVTKNKTQELHAGKVSATGAEEAENFQSFIESRPNVEESLQEHLLTQYRLLVPTEKELRLGEKIIGNLDSKGFNILAPVSLLDSSASEETVELLNQCLSIIQQLEPAGCATDNVEQSLFVQACLKENPPPLALFILQGRLSLLEKPRPAIVAKKLNEAIENEQVDKLQFKIPVTEEDVIVALDFIRTLEPNPSRQFATEGTLYIVPDIRVKSIPATEDVEESVQFEVELLRGYVPEVVLSPVYKKLTEESTDIIDAKQMKYVRSAVKDAEWFINALRYRESTILKAALAIVDFQHEFFVAGPRFLVPLRMKDVAEKIGVHEATVSRLANGKYLQCDWGLFEIRYFFSSQVVVKNTNKNMAGISALDSLEQNEPKVRSKESVKQELKDIIMQYAKENPEAKPLSDQKLSDLLGERGIQVARRTVAKYRGELNIESSFDRK